MSSEFLASSWKIFRGCGTLNHTPGTMWYCFVGKNFVVHLSTMNTTKILPPPKNTRYTVYAYKYMYVRNIHMNMYMHVIVHVIFT